MTKGIILLAAGGTGGHLFPAEALGHELHARGYAVHLVTDARAERFAGKFPADEIHVVPSATFGSKNPVAVARALWTLWKGLRMARRLVTRLRPLAVVGFGGYPTVPPLLASTGLGVPSIVHEQNAIIGRANKALATRVQAIAGGFLPVAGPHAAKIYETGNPVRPAVLAAAETPYPVPGESGALRLVVFGGSQGARFFSEMVPQAIARLDQHLRNRLVLTQQARPEDETALKAEYARLGVKADVAPFFSNLPQRMADAHLVLSRSGASTVLELAVIGRPSILVPLPHSLDDDQGHNAQVLVGAGAALMRRQPAITAESLSADLASLLKDPARLTEMAASARGRARTDATVLLAGLVEAMASGKTIAQFKGVQP
ncbi:undecaprenyldiphospho-muramoylpentapeptide beta-N-acetylglucosaminyltransferase [Rhizobium sp. FY34]|uniref:undecaprenyldiphospho-muramoylpentapeptide beta-N-acetylglucosaminyltransferase n=1 Tax=Rhizobium sp. FY34 TaxID=2562309 RepID=UPI0010C093BE|nr:undecaprenyldiphospho-muramoylpentapeptide beta-N-acetylglucosaminyltransferase [Rhizobium sp. FY34]